MWERFQIQEQPFAFHVPLVNIPTQQAVPLVRHVVQVASLPQQNLLEKQIVSIAWKVHFQMPTLQHTVPLVPLDFMRIRNDRLSALHAQLDIYPTCNKVAQHVFRVESVNTMTWLVRVFANRVPVVHLVIRQLQQAKLHAKSVHWVNIPCCLVLHHVPCAILDRVAKKALLHVNHALLVHLLPFMGLHHANRAPQANLHPFTKAVHAPSVPLARTIRFLEIHNANHALLVLLTILMGPLVPLPAFRVALVTIHSRLHHRFAKFVHMEHLVLLVQ